MWLDHYFFLEVIIPRSVGGSLFCALTTRELFAKSFDFVYQRAGVLSKVGIFAQRVLADYDATPIPLRQAMTYQKALQKHQACGAFLWFLSSLQKMAPSEMWPEIDKSLRSQFSQGYMDPDLLHALETQVPPGDLKSLGAFRHQGVKNQ